MQIILAKEAGGTSLMSNIVLVNRRVASERAFDFARIWFEECGDSDMTSHQHCPPAASAFVPSRLLRVGREGQIYTTVQDSHIVVDLDLQTREHVNQQCSQEVQ